ncbi:hypothetical protein ACFX10_003275 [Malus domestica]
MRREERLREAEEKTAKKRLKRKKKNQRKKEKMKTNSGGEEKQKESSDDDGNPDDQIEQAYGDIQLVAGLERKQAQGSDRKLMLPSRPPTAASSTALVKYTPFVFKEEEEDLKIKLRRILKNFPVRFSNTSGSSAGSPLATSIRIKLKLDVEKKRSRSLDVVRSEVGGLLKFDVEESGEEEGGSGGLT